MFIILCCIIKFKIWSGTYARTVFRLYKAHCSCFVLLRYKLLSQNILLVGFSHSNNDEKFFIFLSSIMNTGKVFYGKKILYLAIFFIEGRKSEIIVLRYECY